LKSIVASGNLYLIKPNVEELSELLDKKIADNTNDIITAAGTLLNKVEIILVSRGKNGAIAITRDIPLAADLVKGGLLVLDDRGSVFTTNNIGERLSMRNAMTELRSYGVMSKSSGSMNNRDVQQFANAFDRELRRWQNR